MNVSEFLQLVRNIVFFVAARIGAPHGMMEWWNVGILGMKSGKCHFILSQKTWSSLRAVGPTLRAGSWARSEAIGYAVNPSASGAGMMEYWNVGMLGLVEWDLIL